MRKQCVISLAAAEGLLNVAKTAGGDRDRVVETVVLYPASFSDPERSIAVSLFTQI
jgi:hypothetical protein